MTIIEQIKAEIERRKMESIGFRNNEKREDWASFFNGEATALENLLSFLSTIESEKPLGLEEEIERKYTNDTTTLRTRSQYSELARYFYDLGCRRTAEKYDEIEYNRQKAEESVPNDLEEAAKKSYPNKEGDLCSLHSTLQRAAFIAGAKWDREQIMKEAVEAEGKVVRDINNELAVTAKNVNLDKFKFGDRVRVIVLPKED